MTEVEMLRSFQIAPDGIRVETWAKGSRRMVDDATLAILIGEGVCALVEHKATGPTENKAIRPKENKRGKK